MYYILIYKVYVKVTEKKVTRNEVLEFHTSRSYNSPRAGNKKYNLRSSRMSLSFRREL